MRLPSSDATWGFAPSVWDYDPSQQKNDLNTSDTSYDDALKHFWTATMSMAEGGIVEEISPEQMKALNDALAKLYPDTQMQGTNAPSTMGGMPVAAGYYGTQHMMPSSQSMNYADGGTVDHFPDPSSLKDAIQQTPNPWDYAAMAAVGKPVLAGLGKILGNVELTPSRGSSIAQDLAEFAKTGQMSPAMRAAMQPKDVQDLQNNGPISPRLADILKEQVSQPAASHYTETPEYLKVLKEVGIDPIRARFPDEDAAETKALAEKVANEPTQPVELPKASGYAHGGPVKHQYVDQAYSTFGAADGGVVPPAKGPAIVKQYAEQIQKGVNDSGGIKPQEWLDNLKSGLEPEASPSPTPNKKMSMGGKVNRLHKYLSRNNSGR
jgi:hypothetical protein